MKRILLAVSLLLAASLAHAQAYSKFQPANGVLKGSTSTYVTTAATAADILALWSGSCSSSTFLRGDGACASAGGGGGSPGGSNTNIQFNSSGSFGGNGELFFTFGGDSTLGLHSAGGEGILLLSNSSNNEWRIKTSTTPSLSFIYQPGLTAPMTLSYASFFANVDINAGLSLAGAAGTAGQVLTSNGTGAAPTWQAGGGGGSPGGSNTQVQFNSSGSFGGSAKMTWTDSTSKLALTSASVGPAIIFNDATGFVFTVGTDGTTGAVDFMQTVAGTFHPLKVNPTGGINIVGPLQFNTNGGQSGQIPYSTGGGSSATPAWGEVKMLAKIASTETTVSTQSVGAQYCVAAPATVSFSSTTTFADDTDLIFDNVGAGAYKFEVQADWTFTNATGGVKVQMAKTATASGPIYTGVGMCNNVAQTAATGTTNSTGFTCTGATGTEAMLNITGTMTVTLAGSVSVQWAQNQSDASATVRQGGATFCITRLN